MSTKISPPIKFFGGKHYLATRLHEIAAPAKYHQENNPGGWFHRVIPFAGGLGEFWNWEYEGVSEVVNDLDVRLTNFWRVLQGELTFEMFRRKVEAIPFSGREWRLHRGMCEDLGWNGDIPDEGRVLRAVNFFVAVRQSLAGRMDSFAPLSRNRTRRGMNEQVSAWLTAVEGLPEVHTRLKRVVILCQDALEVIKKQDGPHTLFYCDCPYYHDTRTSKDVYAYEMDLEQHVALLETLAVIRGRFMLSGYDNDLYRLYEKEWGWRRHEFSLPNNSAGGDKKRRMTEIVWTNF